jgi:hypothetical protein
MSKEYPLDGFALEIKAHWEKYRPQMYRQLEQEGRLDQSLHEASERTGEAFADLVENGLEPSSAWEAVREEWAFVPAESDQPSQQTLPPLLASTEPMQELFPPESDRAERDLTEGSPARVGNEGPSSGLPSTRAHERMNDDELLNYSREHVSYELLMLYETAARLVNDPKVLDDWVVKNALLEAFTIHARVVAAFLFPDVIQPRADDVTALHYVREPSAWAAARGALPAELKTVIARTGKEIAHLTRLRYPPGAPEKGWTLASIVRAFFPPLRRFLEHAVPGRLDISVTAFIAELSDDPALTSKTGTAITFGETIL